jgi:Enoyl-CoA hydratase/isomerase
MRRPLSLAAHRDRLRGSSPDAGVLLVDLDDGDALEADEVPAGLGAIVVGLTAINVPEAHPAIGTCDVALGTRDRPLLDAIEAAAAANPLASTALVMLLRGASTRSRDDGLLAESATYSALQAGPEFSAWRATRGRRVRDAGGEPVHVDRSGGELLITLDRPAVRNALSAAMRDALVDALDLPALDPSIIAVHLVGSGDDFCAGGDLDEFGTFPDPVTAHLVRLRQSVGRSISRVSERVTAWLHGACVGSGIEVPAFAGRVVAHLSTRISLPEVSLGLIPGAGGTVSITDRIGRHRTARLSLTGEVLGATTALEWGLVDEIGTL